MPTLPTHLIAARLYEGLLVCLMLFFPTYVSVLHETVWSWLLYSLFYALFTVFCLKRISGPGKIASLVLSTLPFLFLGALLLVSFSFQAAGFNEAFLYHFNRNGIHGHETRVLFGLLAFVVFFGGVSVLFFLIRPQRAKGRVQLLCLAAMVVLAISSPQSLSFGKMFYEQYSGGSLAGFMQEGESELDIKVKKILDAGSETPDYSVGEKMNVVFIYAESVEDNFSDQELFPGKLNHLDSLKESSLVFTNIMQTPYTGWTISGMVASQCGLPLQMPLASSSHNFGLFDKFMVKAQCMSDLLHKEGYYLTFFGGADLNFAGKGAFLRSHGFDEITGKQSFRKTIVENDKNYSPWGLRDKLLLRSAYDSFRKLSEKGRPFGLFLLTLDTHAPGYPDPDCGVEESVFQENRMLHAVHCSTREVTKFVKKIRRSEYSDQTVIVLMSDHLAHRNPATKVLRKKKRRMTFMINLPSGLHATLDELGTHYDIAPTVLRTIGIQLDAPLGFGHNMLIFPQTEKTDTVSSGRKGFLPEKLQGGGLLEFARHPLVRTFVRKKWGEFLGEIDESGVKIDAANFRISFGKMNLSFRNPRSSRISDPGAVLLKLTRDGLQVLDITSLKDFVRFPSDFSIQHWFAGKDSLYMYIGGKNHIPFLEIEEQREETVIAFIDLLNSKGAVRYIKDNSLISLDDIRNSFRRDGLRFRRHDRPASSHRAKSREGRRVSLISCLNEVCESHIEDAVNDIHKGRWGMSVWQMNDKNEIDMLKHIDHCRNPNSYQRSPNLESLVDSAKKNGQEYLFLIGHNSIFCRSRRDLNDWIGNMRLEKLKGIEFKQPYIGIVDLRTLDIQEFTGKTYVQATMSEKFDVSSADGD